MLIDVSVAEPDEQQANKRERPFKHLGSPILCALILRLIFKLPFGQLESFLKSLFPNLHRFTTIHHRAFSLSQKLESLLRETLADIKSLQDYFVTAIQV